MNTRIVIGAVFAFVFPIALLIWWKKKTGAKFWCFVAGAICFFLFANILESIMHQFVLMGNGPVSAAILASPVLYLLYGSFAAGIFEETGRLFGFKVLLKKHYEKESAVAYGIGHGGIEVILTLGATYVVYLIASAGVPVADAATTAQLMEMSGAIPFGTVLLAMAERISAVMLHIGLSMLMFVGTKKAGRLWLYPVSICIHALSDMPACLYQFGVITSLAVIEALAFVMGLAVLLIGKRVLDKNSPFTAETAAVPEAYV